MFNDEFKKRYTSIPFATYSREHSGSENDLQTLSHNHKEAEIIAVIDGFARFHIDLEIIYAKKGDIIIVSPYQVHHATIFASQNFSHICLCFDMKLLNNEDFKNMFEEGYINACKHIKSDDPLSKRLTEYIQEAYNSEKIKKEGWEFIVTGNLMLIFGELKAKGYLKQNCHANGKTELFRKIIKYIDEHYYEDINSSNLASELFISNAHFCRIFKKNFGYCFHNYLSMYRIEKAKILLTEGKKSISQISELTGFKSFSYFSKMFKLYTSYTPSDYRRYAVPK